MKTILATFLSTFLALSVLAGLAGQASAAAIGPAGAGAASAVVVAAADYDSPGFGSQQWWQQQEDMGG